MSRNSKSFHQLLNYLDKEDSNNSFTWNMYADIKNNRELVEEFMQNSKYIDNKRGKIYLYHEVISLENITLSPKEIEKILHDLASKYVNARAKHHLVYGNIHTDTNNPHIHLMISSNEIEGSKRIRLSKSEFASIQSHLEIYKNEKYKELETTRVYGKNKDISKAKQSEQELKHKRKKTSKKDYVKESLETIFSNVASKTYLENALKSRGLEIYQRGKTTGVIYECKKYRLKTIGLEDSYKKYLIQIEKNESRKNKRQEFKKSKSKDNEQSYSR